MPFSEAIFWLLSTLTLTKTACPAYFLANFSIIGDTILQGIHHSAQKSATTTWYFEIILRNSSVSTSSTPLGIFLPSSLIMDLCNSMTFFLIKKSSVLSSLIALMFRVRLIKLYFKISTYFKIYIVITITQALLCMNHKALEEF